MSKLIILHNNIGAMIDNIADNTDNSLSNEAQKSNSGGKVYACSYCSAKFDQFIDYVRHIRLRHPDKAKDKAYAKCREGPPGGTRWLCISLCILRCWLCVSLCLSLCLMCVLRLLTCML